MTPLPRDLRLLSAEAGVMTSYWDNAGQLTKASPEALLATLRALGIPISKAAEAAEVTRQLRHKRRLSLLAPVAVGSLKEGLSCTLQIPIQLSDRALQIDLHMEDGSGTRRFCVPASKLPTLRTVGLADDRVLLKRLTLPGPLAYGYHRLEAALGDRRAEGLVISAPRRTASRHGRHWGAFAPLHAIWSDRSWGIGDFTDLEQLGDFVGEKGGDLVGTLPLYASFLDLPFEPSPYSPCSRLFWNEVFIDVERVPEWETCEAARALASSRAFKATLKALKALSHVDYRGVMAHKRRVLEIMCNAQADGSSSRATQFQRAWEQEPRLADYARFRAVVERRGKVWQEWPERLQSGSILDSDYDQGIARYHAYVQWIAREQLDAVAGRKSGKTPLYLDLPLGVNPSGFDVYQERDAFLCGSSTGAPPDPFFTKGQDWGFPPPNPGGLRKSHYRYFIAVLRNSLRYAGTLRIDHIMGLHRLYVIPRGFDARQGVYIRYPARELYAILSLEAHRCGGPVIVGEDLGTVPEEVRTEMNRRGLHRMYVMQYEPLPPPSQALPPVPAEVLASLNTHDMPTFAAYYAGADITDRVRLGLLSGREEVEERRLRRAQKLELARALRDDGWLSKLTTPRNLLGGVLAYLAASPARLLLVGLEDLWLEPKPQNVPGTHKERPNWTRRSRHSLEALRRLPSVRQLLNRIHRLRSGGGTPHA